MQDWSKFSEEAEDKGNPTFRQISILLRIFIASLPFRKNEDSAYKINALDELREFHQAYSEEFTKDPVCLPLFAFPFVSDPTVHPAFTVVFTVKIQTDHFSRAMFKTVKLYLFRTNGKWIFESSLRPSSTSI